MMLPVGQIVFSIIGTKLLSIGLTIGAFIGKLAIKILLAPRTESLTIAGFTV